MKSSDSGGSSPKDQAASVAGLLERQIAEPLVRVQTALAKETVLWKRGVLVMPQVQLLDKLPVQNSSAYGGTMCRGKRGVGGLWRRIRRLVEGVSWSCHRSSL